MAKKQSDTVRIKYVRSAIGRPRAQKDIVRGLGFRKLNQIVERPNTPAVWGMIDRVIHLVEVIEGEKS